MPIAQQLGAVDPNTGQIDAQKLRQGMAQFSSGGAMGSQLDKLGMGWAKPMIDFAIANPIGMAVVGGGVLMLLGSLMGGGGGMGLLGAGAMALGAFGGLDGLAQQSGLFGGGQQQQQPPPTPPAAAPPQGPIQAGDDGARYVLPHQQQQQPQPQQQQPQPPQESFMPQLGHGVARGFGVGDQGFDPGAAMQNLLPQVQQILPDVTSEEVMNMMNQLGDNAHQVFDLQPQEIAKMIQALRERQQ
jgi:hypothetical protein